MCAISLTLATVVLLASPAAGDSPNRKAEMECKGGRVGDADPPSANKLGSTGKPVVLERT